MIFCQTPKETQNICQALHNFGVLAAYFHSGGRETVGLTKDEKDEVQRQWRESELQVIVCTDCFGMGIDKKNVACVNICQGESINQPPLL